MVREFFRWWLAQLADLIPARLGRFGSRELDAVIVAPLAPLSSGVREVTLSWRRNGKETPIGEFRVGTDEFAAALSQAVPRQAVPRQAVLRLPGSDVLNKALALPLASESHLHQALTFELDRETPFLPEEVFWTHRVVERDRRMGRLRVRLLLMPRAQLASLIAGLGDAGIRPRRAEIASGPDRGAYIPLDTEDRRNPVGARFLRPAFACCIILAAAAAIVPFARQAWSLANVERAIAADRVAAAEAERLRREIDRLSGSADLVEHERKEGGRPLAVLAALTGLLPADTYLTDFQEQKGQVAITGRSAGASRLIAILSNGGLLRNPAFAAPVTRLGGGEQEMFTISAEVAP